MNIALWIVQALLAVVFLVVGLMKLVQSKDKLTERMRWAEDFSQRAVWLIGIAETLGGLGLVLPAWTGILPWLTPLAAVGLAAIQVGAASTHYRRKEYRTIIINAILIVLTVFVAYGRFSVFP